MYYVNQGVHLAGPNLTPEAFKVGAFEMPGRGGAYDDQVTTQGNKVGDLGLGYPEYALLGPKDFALVWWDPDARGLGNIIGNPMNEGNYRYLEGGKRYTLQQWKKGDPAFFEDLDTSVTHYVEPPANDVPPEYPCDGCPSTGGAQVPANVRGSKRDVQHAVTRQVMTPRSRAQARFLRAEPTWAMCTTCASPWLGSPCRMGPLPVRSASTASRVELLPVARARRGSA